jgi:hypothetical protein
MQWRNTWRPLTGKIAGFYGNLAGTATGGPDPLFGCVLRPPLVRKGKKGPDIGNFSV